MEKLVRYSLKVSIKGNKYIECVVTDVKTGNVYIQFVDFISGLRTKQLQVDPETKLPIEEETKEAESAGGDQ